METALGNTDELWIRQVWFARLRWIMPPLVVALGFLVELVTRRRLFPTLPVLGLAAFLLGINVVYRTLLRRFGGDTEAHARELTLLAHVQVLGDLLVATIGIHLSGGATSAFWPFLSLTVMASALFFARRAFVAVYAVVAALMCWTVCVLDGGGWLPPNALVIACLLALVALVCGFYGERMDESRALARTKDEILSRVTHELRTPLSALRGFVYLAQKREAARSDETPPQTKLGQTLERIDVRSIGWRAW